jgi:hypothetical protein
MAGRALRKVPEYPPGVQIAVDYADAVIAGTVDAGRLVHLACERFRRDREEGGPWEFRAELAERAMDFAGQMPNIKGPEAGHPLHLMSWQQLVFTNLFGFVEPGTSTRRFRQGVVFVPRGNGKTTFAAPLALYMTFMTGEGGAEGYAAAVPHGHVAAALGTAHKIGLDRILGPDGNRCRDLVLALLVGRILEPTSKLAAARALSPTTAASSLGEVLGLGEVDEDEL